jgi:phosphoadenosine phosphosulfate reductase
MTFSDKTGELISRLGRYQETHSPITLACSFGLEDMVLLDAIAKHVPQIVVFTLDTGRLPEETHALLDTIRNIYSVPVLSYFPDAAEVESWVDQNGPNGFYRSVAQREQCCHIRKVKPLQRALAGKKAWITGLRREQSAQRQNLQLEAWDDANGLVKLSPLLDWALDDVWGYIKANDVPYNALHDRGYPSIGCAPCTRAVREGEDIRAGRWWWEQAGTKECGLHRHKETAV